MVKKLSIYPEIYKQSRIIDQKKVQKLPLGTFHLGRKLCESSQIKKKNKDTHNIRICQFPNCLAAVKNLPKHLQTVHGMKRDKCYQQLLQCAPNFRKFSDIVTTCPKKIISEQYLSGNTKPFTKLDSIPLKISVEEQQQVEERQQVEEKQHTEEKRLCRSSKRLSYELNDTMFDGESDSDFQPDNDGESDLESSGHLSNFSEELEKTFEMFKNWLKGPDGGTKDSPETISGDVRRICVDNRCEKDLGKFSQYDCFS